MVELDSSYMLVNVWVLNLKKPSGLGKLIKIEHFLSALLENVGEELDPIGEGCHVYPPAPDFRFYITTKLPNPHYLPETSVKVL